jgi:asparagine synthase (glutamine-hydrolysing)
MCGIFGLVEKGKQTLEPSVLSQAEESLSQLKHRGPDAQNFKNSNNWFLGNTRLAILDISGGGQPVSKNDRVHLVFNGEIYNHSNLRQQLIEQSHTFKTQSDTEVVIQAYHEWGENFPLKLEGMFAIAIIDESNKQLLLIRDRFGEKPLYYALWKGFFLFSSETKSLHKFGDFKVNIDKTIESYLQLRHIPSPESAFEDIYRLEPGSVLKLDLDTLEYTIERYYKHSKPKRSAASANYEKAAFADVFEDSVSNCIESSDEPVGLFLSGGLDSSSIAVAALNRGYSQLETYSIGYFLDEEDEVKKAVQVSELLGITNKTINISSQTFWDNLPKMISTMDEPIFDLANVPLYILSGEVSKSKKVVLSGEGADEVLFGYDFQKLLLKSRIANTTKRLLPSFLKPAMSHLPLHEFFASEDSNFLSFGKPFISSLFKSTELKEALIKDRELDAVALLFKKNQILDIDHLQNLYRRSWLVDHLLQRTDRISMSKSLEVRLPFLNHRLVEYCDALPLRQLVKPRLASKHSKIVLRNYAARYLPTKLVEQEKKGFFVPSNVWLRHLNGYYVRELLQSKSSRISIYMSRYWLDNLLLDFEKDDSKDSYIWSLIFLEIWLRQNEK